jgi:aryl-alcohol dehydrogenase-like predicted oxidoreductase
MSYGAPEQNAWLIPEEEALPILDHCYKNKLNFYDTSNNYSNGISEEILGKAIKKFNWRRANIVIATKVFGVCGRGLENAHALSNDEREQAGYVNQFGLSRKHIFDSVDASLQRLGLDYIDLLQIHRWDPLVSAKEVMKALNDVVATGKVRYIGASSMCAHQFLELQYTARLNGWTEFVSMQNLHNAVYREEEKEMYPACQKFGVAGMPWSPVAMGFLTRPASSFSDTTRGDSMNTGMWGRPWTDSDKKTNAKIEEIAKARGTSMAIVAIAWSLSKPFIHSPIVGLSNKKRVDEAIEAMNFKLTDEEIKAIDDLYEVHDIIGHDS